MITAKEALKLTGKDYSKGYLKILDSKIRDAAKLSYYRTSYAFCQKVNEVTLRNIEEELKNNGFEVFIVAETTLCPWGAIEIRW